MGDAGRRIHKVAVTTEADVDGTWDQAAADLVNELKAIINDLIAKLKDGGLMES